MENGKIRTGIFAWYDNYILEKVDPALEKCGRAPEEFVRLGNFNTPEAAENHLDSFDLRLDEIVNCGFGMLTGKLRERRVLFSPELVLNSSNDRPEGRGMTRKKV